MTVKEYYESIKPLLKNNDLIYIYALESLPNGETINHYIKLPNDLKKYPLLNDLKIIESNNYIVKYSNATITGKETKKGTAQEYCALIDYNEMRKAKGLKPLIYNGSKTNKAPRYKKRFTL